MFKPMQAHPIDKDLSSISDAATALRSLTQDRHRAVEALPVFRRLMQAEATREDYVAALRVHYRFYALIEPALEANDALGLPYQARLPLLKRDLAALGSPLPEKSVHSFAITSNAAACGCRYVIEGSALGGQIITRHLRERLGEALGSALAFYTLDGKPSASWPEIQGALARQLHGEQAIIEAAEYANRVFGLLEDISNGLG